MIAEHQRGGEGPGLATEVLQILRSGTHAHTRRLLHLASDRRFGGLSRLDKSRERGEPRWLPADLAAEESAIIVVANEDNHGRVGARKVRRIIDGAMPRPACIAPRQTPSALGTVPMVTRPVIQRHRRHHQSGIHGIEARARHAKVRPLVRVG